MNKLYVMRMDSFLDPETYEKGCSLLKGQRKNKLDSIRQKEDKARSLAAGLLLQYALKMESECRNIAPNGDFSYDSWDGEYMVGAHGKPCLSSEYQLHFNLSHSKEYVICGIANRNIGVDIQYQKPVKEGFAERFFHEEEISYLREKAVKTAMPDVFTTQYLEAFYDIFTLKESFMKLEGTGMGLGMESYSVIPLLQNPDGMCGIRGIECVNVRKTHSLAESEVYPAAVLAYLDKSILLSPDETTGQKPLETIPGYSFAAICSL